MESIVIGLPDLAIKAVLSKSPLIFQVRWVGIPQCPHCEHKQVRIKDTFWREIRSIPLQGKPSRLKVRCHKYICKACNRYFNTRLPGVKRWNRTTEPLKKMVFRLYNRGYSCKDIALENNIGVASAERYYHQMIGHKDGHLQNRLCPRVLGIDEHRFTRKVGFLTTFCDLQKRRIFDVAKGKSAHELESFLSSLQGRERVKVVCIDLTHLTEV